MRRTVWIALGATAGVIAYRRGQKLLEEARERGVVGSVQAATLSASSVAASARTLLENVSGAAAPQPPQVRSAPVTGAAAARVLAESRTAG
ncbi:MAG: hypothetical protein ACOYNJ_11795 [Candidatus Nanopelagicales bacterium]|jgi:hypothetical protein